MMLIYKFTGADFVHELAYPEHSAYCDSAKRIEQNCSTTDRFFLGVLTNHLHGAVVDRDVSSGSPRLFHYIRIHH